MLNELFQTYKKIIIAVFLVGCGLVFWFFGCHRQQENHNSPVVWERTEFDTGGYGYHFEANGLKGDVVFGIKGYTVKDADLPVKVNILSEEKAFEGSIKITLPGSNSGGVAYQKAVSVEKNMDSSFELSIPHLGNASYFAFEIRDAYDNTLLSKLERPDFSEWNMDSEANGQICVGILSNEFSNFSFLDSILLNSEEGSLRICSISLDKDSFPTSRDSMDMLSCILIDNYKMKNLSEDQRDALLGWVKRGGNLLIATGEYGSRNIGPLESELKVKSGEVYNERIYFGDATDFSGELGLYLNQLKFQEDAGWQRLHWSDPAAFYERSYGNGKVQVLRFSFNDDSLLQWNHLSDMARSIFEGLLAQQVENNIDQENGLWCMEMALHDFYNSQMPNAFFYGVFFLVYLIVMILSAYFLLSRYKKRELIWNVVPIIAIGFTLVVWFRSKGTPSQSQSSLSAIRVVDDQSQKNSIYMLYQNEEGESMELNLIPSVDRVTPMDFEYVQDNSNESRQTAVHEDYKIIDSKNGPDIEFSEATPGTVRMLEMTENSTMNYGEKTKVFDVKVNADFTTFFGEITNEFNRNFSKVVAIRGNQYWTCGPLKSQESVSIKADDVRCWSQSGEEYTLSEGEDSPVVQDICSYLIYEYLNNNDDMNQLIVVGITEEEHFRILRNDSYPANQISIYANRQEIREVEKASCDANIHLKYLKDLTYTQLQEMMYDSAEEDVNYQFDLNKNIKYLIRNRDEYQGKIYAYNYWKGEKERILSNPGDRLDAEELEPYLSEKKEMTLSFKKKKDSEDNHLPILSIWFERSGPRS